MAYGGFIWTPPRNSGGIPLVSTRFSLSMEMSRLTRDGTAEPVSRDQILRHARGQGNIIFPVQLTTSRIGNLTGLIHTLLYVMTIHTYIHTRKMAKVLSFQTIPHLYWKNDKVFSLLSQDTLFLGGNIGCRDKTSSWYQKGSPM